MRLRVLDQIHISAVQADTLRPGQVVEIDEDAGRALIARHPGFFAEAKAAPAAQNKAAPAAQNKAAPTRRTRSGPAADPATDEQG